MDKLQVHMEIEKIVQAGGTDYIDAVLHYCQKNNLEIETVGALIAKDVNLVSKISREAENLNYIKKTSKLPL